MKAYIARNVFDDAGFYPVYQRIDPMMDKAFETLGVSVKPNRE